MATEIWVNIGSGNGLLPNGTKPLPEPMLTYHKYGPVTLIWEQFHKDTSAIDQQNELENYSSKIYFESPRGQWVDKRGLLRQFIPYYDLVDFVQNTHKRNLFCSLPEIGCLMWVQVDVLSL